MEALNIARKLTELGQVEKALRAYSLVLADENASPEDLLEATVYIFYNDGDYQICFTKFVELYNKGFFQDEIFKLLVNAFYAPNAEKLQKQYKKNIRCLSQYQYCFNKDFPDFDDLPIRFFPFNENGFIPFDTQKNRFESYIDSKDEPAVTRYFFKNLDKPILAENVFTDYEFEYLCDNVRKSEDVAMDNHVYLHYDKLAEFCSYLCIMDIAVCLKTQKLVFLFGDEIAKYPIDFLKEYNIDYTAMVPRAVRVEEVKRLVYYNQFSTHNGLNFFEEILDNHPNLLFKGLYMMDLYREYLDNIYEVLKRAKNVRVTPLDGENQKSSRVMNSFSKSLFSQKRTATRKECVVLDYLMFEEERGRNLNERIVPAVLLSLHESNPEYNYGENDGISSHLNKALNDTIEHLELKKFKYIRTFTPIRNFTTGYGAALHFVEKHISKEENKKMKLFMHLLSNRLLSRGYYVDPSDKLFRHSCIVRFEDGKLNPKATFTALSEFLDIPYTDSMTYCSLKGEINPQQLNTNVTGFDTTPVYNEYSEYLSDEEKYNLEMVTCKEMARYGYKPHYYDGKIYSKEEIITRLVTPPEKLYRLQVKKIEEFLSNIENQQKWEIVGGSKVDPEFVNKAAENFTTNMTNTLNFILNDKPLVTPKGEFMRLVPRLMPKEELLEQPLYE